jgi:fibronectin-binding autotransporter adhesin
MRAFTLPAVVSLALCISVQPQAAIVSGTTSLRDAIAGAQSGDTITFDASLSGKAISFSGLQIRVDKNLTIDASALAEPVTLASVFSDDQFFVFGISSGAVLNVRGVIFQTGDAPIFDNFGVLNISNCVFTNATIYAGWGGIQNETNATVTIADSTFWKNSYGVKDLGGTVHITGSAFESGTVDSAAKTTGGKLQIENSTFRQNNFALSLNTGSLVLSNSVVSLGRSFGDAGIIINAGDAHFIDSAIVTNLAPTVLNAGSLLMTRCNVSSNAGGIINVGNLVVIDSQFRTNVGKIGGAIRNAGQLFATNTVFEYNSATDAGGAIVNEAGSATLKDCQLTRNAGSSGGAVYNNAEFTAVDCVFNQNYAVNGATGYNYFAGGALYISNGIVALNHCTLTENKALYAGAIYKWGGQMTLSRCKISDNVADSYQNFVCEAGGIYNVNGDFVINDSTISSNRVGSYGGSILIQPQFPGQPPTILYFRIPGDGGGLKVSRGNGEVTGCTIAFNYGGGVYQSNVGDAGQRLIIRNSTIVSNVVEGSSGPYGTLIGGQGGGIYAAGALGLEHCTIVGNSAVNSGTPQTEGGGIYVSGSISITNSIVAKNVAGKNADIAGTYTGSGNLLSGEPGLGPLGNFGGPTQTMPPLLTSAARDAAGPTTLAFDQRGLARIVGAKPDIGAVEIDLEAPAVALHQMEARQMSSGNIEVRFFAPFPLPIYASGDPGSPKEAWEFVGYGTEVPPQSGLFRFEIPQEAGAPRRFYVIRNL